MSRRVAIIGAGLSGAACARQLVNAGAEVVLFDKRARAGGSLATWRAETPLGAVQLDHGAQYITARSDAFAAQMSRWVAAGVAEPWDARFAAFDARGHSKPFSALAWVGRPGMDALAVEALRGLDVRFETHVAGVIGEPGLWRLQLQDGSENGFYTDVVSAAPASQAQTLLANAAPNQASAAQNTRTLPCWSAMVVFDQPFDAPFDAAKFAEGPVAWLARNVSKPGRSKLEAWVIHGASAWSAERLDAAPAEIARTLVKAAVAQLRAPQPVWMDAHLWPDAFVKRAVGAPFGWDRSLRIGSCGDWYLGPRAELAWESGNALGEVMIEPDAVEPETLSGALSDAPSHVVPNFS